MNENTALQVLASRHGRTYKTSLGVDVTSNISNLKRKRKKLTVHGACRSRQVPYASRPLIIAEINLDFSVLHESNLFIVIDEVEAKQGRK